MGNPNVRHFESFLEAELSAVTGKKFDAMKNYEICILLAARGGFQHDAAWASERYGRFCLTLNNEQDEANYRLQEAIKYYRGWGALAKVNALEAEFPHLVEKPIQIFADEITLDLGMT